MKAPEVNIKDVLKKLSFLKNNLALLVPIVIVIVALLSFIPTRILSGKLRQMVETQSVSMGRKVDRLARDANSAVDPETLESYIEQYAQDANAIDALMAQTVQRALLSYDIFPDTNETSIALYEAFGREYRVGIEAMLERLNAGVCPADAEIEAALKSAPRTGMMPGRGGAYGDAYGGGGAYGGDAYGGAYGGGLGRGRRSMGMMSPMHRKIIDQLCLDRARAAGVYAALADVPGYAYWAEWKFENKDQAYKDCWYWQLGYWIIEDITETIRVMNDGSASLLEAPVKRFSNVDFRMKRSRGGRRRGRGRRTNTEDTNPIYATDTKDALTTPCTGRFTNEEIDVVQFNVRLVVEVDQVVPFMQALSSAKTHTFRGFYGKQPEKTYTHNQISVLESSVGPIDPESIDHDMYRYGDMPVVELSLLCEYVFYKTPAFEEIKPQQIKDELAGEEEEV